MSFNSDIKRFIRKAEGNAEKVFRGTAIALFTQVIRKTPVDTGRLRANWQTDLNKPATGELTVTDKTGNQTILKARLKAGRAKIGDKLYMVNTLPYAKAIEYGHSREKAPQGMVRITVAAFRAEIERQAKKVNR